ncbi:hypothetical protein H0W26_03175 [Candidatus Dependentiae bacterium]|nr:hypothetical protein [Candidatus Dependentiae bacterium]
MKNYISICLLALCTGPLGAEPIKELPLTDPLLRGIDGLAGIMDKTKIEKNLWLIKEIKNIHNGIIKISAQGIPDPSRSSKIDYLMFRNQPQTLKALIELEKQVHTFSSTERAEFDILFKKVKEYFAKCNAILLEDAHGAQDIMMKLINEFCRKRNRPESFLLTWKKGSSENELYNNSMTSFRVLHIFSTDLMNFLADLVISCPKALKAFNDSIKRGS